MVKICIEWDTGELDKGDIISRSLELFPERLRGEANSGSLTEGLMYTSAWSREHDVALLFLWHMEHSIFLKMLPASLTYFQENGCDGEL